MPLANRTILVPVLFLAASVIIGCGTAPPRAMSEQVFAERLAGHEEKSLAQRDEIAERLWLTESGVKRAITRLLRKLELDGGNPRVQLTRAYYQLTGRAAGDE